MVIDSSALIAILLREPEEAKFRTAILASTMRLTGAPSYLETAMVLIGCFGPSARPALDRLIAAIHAEVVPFPPAQAHIATDAFLRFGEGRRLLQLPACTCDGSFLRCYEGLATVALCMKRSGTQTAWRAMLGNRRGRPRSVRHRHTAVPSCSGCPACGNDR
jgi:ribonuclease VapC